MENPEYLSLIKKLYNGLRFWEYVIIKFSDSEDIESIIVRSRLSTILTLGIVGTLTTPYYIYLKGPSPFIVSLWYDLNEQHKIQSCIL